MKDIKGKVIRFLLLIPITLYGLTVLYPLIWMILSGFKDNQQLMLSPFKLPQNPSWDNYYKAWEVGVGTYFLNSVIVTVVATFLTVLCAALLAFVLARYKFKLHTLLFTCVLGGMMLSPEVSIISLYKLLQILGLYNTRWALIIPYAAFHIPFTTFLLWSYFQSLPLEVEESAYIDGCNSFQIFYKMIIPMSKPIIATGALLTAMGDWNEFMFGLVFIESSALKTIPVGLMNLRAALTTNWGVLISGLTVASLPMIIVYLIFQKQLVRGMTAGSVKG